MTTFRVRCTKHNLHVLEHFTMFSLQSLSQNFKKTCPKLHNKLYLLTGQIHNGLDVRYVIPVVRNKQKLFVLHDFPQAKVHDSDKNVIMSISRGKYIVLGEVNVVCSALRRDLQKANR